jgi:hypothetical protein
MAAFGVGPHIKGADDFFGPKVACAPHHNCSASNFKAFAAKIVMFARRSERPVRTVRVRLPLGPDTATQTWPAGSP